MTIDWPIILSLIGLMFLVGMVIGFIGAGGAGIVVALLTTAYGLPIHVAIGTALGTMCLTTVSGAISHVREGNVAPRIGAVVGISGAVGAVLGAYVGQGIPEARLQVFAGLGLWFLAALVWVRSRMEIGGRVSEQWSGEPQWPTRLLVEGVGIGGVGGVAAALLGVGMAPFIQLGYLARFHLPLRQTVGTTMFTLFLISLSGAIALATADDVSYPYLVGATIGLASGAYLGAKFTRRAPRQVLRAAIVTVPIIAGAMLLFL